MDGTESLKIAGYWLELKRFWDEWCAGNVSAQLSAEAQRYFEDLSLIYFNRALDCLGGIYENVPRLNTGLEAWTYIIHYFTKVRPEAALLVLDDLFIRAEQRCDETAPSVNEDDEQALAETPESRLGRWLAILITQFKMRLRDAVTAYAREFGTEKAQKITSSLDLPPQKDAAPRPEPAAKQAWAGSEVERREIEVVGGKVGKDLFPTIRPAFKLRLQLRHLRESRQVIIAVDSDEVLALVGLQTATFSAGLVTIKKQLLEALQAEPAFMEMDLEGQSHLVACAVTCLSDSAERWTHKGQCVPDFIAVNASASAEKKVPALRVVDRLSNFAELLHGSLLIKKALRPEDELVPLFTAIEVARQNYSHS